MYLFIYKNPSEKIGQSGGASQWRVYYQRGLPRLVSTLVLYTGHEVRQISCFID